MSDQKCVVEGCNLEYDVVCSFSFYNVNTATESSNKRQEWIEGAMAEESECLWRHVSLQLCGYHFELDTQGLWIDSPMLPELLTLQKQYRKPTQADKEAYEQIKKEHDYLGPESKDDKNDSISRLNVRQLVDTLGYLSLKNLKRKQLWVVKVETDKSEASITQSEQVISKLPDPKQVIEIIPQASSSDGKYGDSNQTEVLQMMDDTTISDNFIYEIAEEQEISMDEVKEIPMSENQEWMVNIIPEETKPKYAYVKHTASGKKKRHFTTMDQITLHGDFDNYYILPDVDPSVGVEITTSYEPENYIVEEYEHLVIEKPRKRSKDAPESARKRKKKIQGSTRDEVKEIQIKSEMEAEDWNIDTNIVYEQDGSDDYDDKKGRVRRKNKKYLGYDFVT